MTTETMHETDVVSSELEDTVESERVQGFATYLDDILSDNDLRRSVLGAKLDDALRDTDVMAQFSEFAAAAEESTTVFSDQFTVTDWAIESVTIEELIEGSQFQEQFGVLTTPITSIFLDKTIGLLNNGFLFLNPFEAIRRKDGTLVLTGAHHRLFAISIAMRLGGAEWGDILDMEVPCLVGTLDVSKIADINDVPKSEADKFVLEMEANYWLASNMSRKPTPIEKSSYSNAKKGVSLLDPSSILESKVLSSKDKAVYLMRSEAYRLGFLPDLKTGATEKQWVAFPQNSGIARYWAEPTDNAFSKIASSFISNLLKIKEEIPNDEGKKAKSVSIWQPTVQSGKGVIKLIEFLFTEDEQTGASPIELAIHKGLSKSTSEFNTNIARNASAIGQSLAHVVHTSLEPIVKPVKRANSSESSSKKPTKFKTRRIS
jgi:hypothetical protein